MATSLLSLFVTAFMLLGFAPEVHAQTDQGWSEPVNLSNAGASSDPLLVIDARGVMHVIWNDFFDGYKYSRSTDGLTWTTPTIVAFPFSPKDDSRPTLIASPNGAIHVFWTDQTNALYYVQAKSANFGIPSAWGANVQLTDSAVDFHVAVDHDGALHLSYVRNLGSETSPAGVYYRRLDGSGWSPAVNLYLSQYFRSTDGEDAHIRIAASRDNNQDRVYVVWDDRQQKRIFMARSLDQGKNWEKVLQLRGPEDSAGFAAPFNVDVSVSGSEVLLLWQVGQPGGRCTQYSQWSTDGGDHFGDSVRPLDEFVSCPESSEFIVHTADFSVVLFNIQDDLSLIAWNGARWSKLQSQSEMSTFSNPVTFDNVIFECPNAAVHNSKMYVVGCDRGTSGDIWFRSRSLGSLQEWFPPPSAWTLPETLTSNPQKITSISAVADYENNVHALWVQTPQLEIDKGDITIQYALWNGEEWSKPGSIIAGFDSPPSDLSLGIDSQGRLLLLWVGGENGDINFSWAKLDRANLASEWSEPQRLPTPSEISGSPSILVDSSSRILVVYAVPLNENRGIYAVQSDDLGKSWSQPIQIFDAVSAMWDSADEPAISLSEDGKLHLLFSRHSLREEDETNGLYYSQSSDGGSIWSRPEVVSDKSVRWSRLVSFADRTLHRIWQENNDLSIEILHQISQDAGITWGSPIIVSSIRSDLAWAALSQDGHGKLYLTQIHAENELLVVQVLEWDGSRWNSLEGREINVKGEDTQFSIATGFTSQGVLNIIVSVDHPDLVTGLANQVLGFGRTLGSSAQIPSPGSLLIPTLATLSNANNAPEIQATATESSPLANLYDSSAPSYKNWVGMTLIGGLVILILFAIWPRRKGESN